MLESLDPRASAIGYHRVSAIRQSARRPSGVGWRTLDSRFFGKPGFAPNPLRLPSAFLLVTSRGNPCSRSLSGGKGMVGELENGVGCCLGCNRQHRRIVIRKVIAPEVRPVHTATIEARYVTFVIAKIPPQRATSADPLQQSCRVRMPVSGMPIRANELESVPVFPNGQDCDGTPTELK